MQAVKTTTKLIKEKKVTLVPSTVKLFTTDKKGPVKRGPRVPEGKKKAHKETGVTASNKQEHRNCRAKLMVTMVTMGGDLQPGCMADRLLTGLGQPQINP
jgi:hypothetical protein